MEVGSEALMLDPVAVQVVSVRIEPLLGALHRRADLAADAPEPRRVVHLNEMGDLVGGEIVENVRRREDQAPGERKGAGRGAGAPTTGLIADREPLDLDAELGGIGFRRTLKVAASLALEEVADATVRMLDAAGDAENALPAVAHFRPHRTARAGTMNDPMRDAAKRYHCARLERRGLRQTTETCRDPCAVALREVFCFGERAARRHGEDGFAITRMNSERVTARAAMPAQSNRKILRSMGDQEGLRLVRPPIEECASGHVCQSGGQESARILP